MDVIGGSYNKEMRGIKCMEEVVFGCSMDKLTLRRNNEKRNFAPLLTFLE